MSLEELQQEFNDELGNDEEVVNEKLKQKKYWTKVLRKLTEIKKQNKAITKHTYLSYWRHIVLST